MRVVEIVGGLYTRVQERDFKFVEKMLEKNIKKLNKEKLSDRQQIIAQRFVDNHIMDYDGEYYYIREVYLDV